MQLIEILGLFAGFCTTASFVPQALKTWRTKSAKDFSWLMLVMFLVGVFLWLVYGVYKNDFPIIAANAVTELLVLSIVVAKLKFG